MRAAPEIAQLNVGLAHLFIRHTSASLTLNENASPDARRDFESFFDEAVPEEASYWTHVDEGSDDMPAHVKAALLGPELTIPVAGGRLALGTWQGIYLCEHRDRGGSRAVVLTLFGGRELGRRRARAAAEGRAGCCSVQRDRRLGCA